MDLPEFIVENLFCESLWKKEGFDTFHLSQSITHLDEPTNNILCLSGGTMMSRTEEHDRRVLAQLPGEDGIVPLFPWWQAKSGIAGIHDWYVKLCWKVLRVEPHSLVIRPHVNAKTQVSEEEIWKKYNKRLARVKPPDTNIPKKTKGNVKV
jgi:hypothetical protein